MVKNREVTHRIFDPLKKRVEKLEKENKEIKKLLEKIHRICQGK